MQFLTFILTGLLAASAAPQAVAQDGPKPGDVTIGSTTVVNSGSGDRDANGCPSGSVGTALATDNSFMTLIFDKLSAEIGKDAPAANRRVICSVDVKINSPDGWQYCAETADYRGYTNLDAGVNGTIKASYNFGRGEEARIQKNVNGPLVTDFLLHQDGEVAKKVWSACGTTTSTFKMNLSIALASKKKDSTGIIITDSADAKFKQTLSLGWRKCPDQAGQTSQPSQPTQPTQPNQPSQVEQPTVGYTAVGSPLTPEQANQGVGK